MSSYDKFLKDLCTKKRNIHIQKKVFLTENVSSILQHKISLKYKYPSSPTISCSIGNHTIENALLDLGASVNLLPLLSIFETWTWRITPNFSGVTACRSVHKNTSWYCGGRAYPGRYVLFSC